MSDFTVAIMAGGKSSRMGRNKALIKIGQQTILERIIERTADLGQHQTLLVTNTPEVYADFGLDMVSDVLPDCGALGGIYTALHYSTVPYSTVPYTVVIACDMPFVSADVLRLMLSYRADYDAVVPTVGGYPQGLHAVYSQNCLPSIRQRLELGKLKVSAIYDNLRVKYLDETAIAPLDKQGLALSNINTPDDLEKLKAGI